MAPRLREAPPTLTGEFVRTVFKKKRRRAGSNALPGYGSLDFKDF